MFASGYESSCLSYTDTEGFDTDTYDTDTFTYTDVSDDSHQWDTTSTILVSSHFLLSPRQRRAGDYSGFIEQLFDVKKEFNSAIVGETHDLSRDSSSGIESGEATQSDLFPYNNSFKPGAGHQIQHKALVHNGTARISPQQQTWQQKPQLSTSKYLHHRDPSWSSQTNSDSDVIQAGSRFSSSDTDNNNTGRKTPISTKDKNTRCKTPLELPGKHTRSKTPTRSQEKQKPRPKTPVITQENCNGKTLLVNNSKTETTAHSKVKGTASKCAKHVTFQSPAHQEQNGQRDHTLFHENQKKDNEHFRESNILYYEDDEQYIIGGEQYYHTTKQNVFQDSDISRHSETTNSNNSHSQGQISSNQSQGKPYLGSQPVLRAKSPLMQAVENVRALTPVPCPSNVPNDTGYGVQSLSISNQDSLVRTPSKSDDGLCLDVLPDDVIVRIFSHLPSDQICRCSGVSRKWYELAWTPQLWTTINMCNPFINVDRALKFLMKRLSYNTPGLCIIVEKIQLNGCELLTDKGLFTIAKRCSELRHLEIQGCVNVSNIAIFEVVSRCVNLEHLNVTGCEMVTCISLTPQATVQAQTYGKQVDLRYLDMSDCYNLEDAGLQIIASYCSQLVYLYLRRCSKVTDIGVQYVANYCHDLKELSISDCNRLTDFGMKEIARLGSKLRYLSVAKCEQVTDIGVKYIAKYCHRIRYLNVRGCEGVTDESVQSLSRQCQRLRSLDIGKCDVTDEGLQALAINSPQLKKLSLKSCDAITDRGITHIAEKCRLLQQLNIQECNITVTGYRKVRSMCKKCMIEHTNPGFY